MPLQALDMGAFQATDGLGGLVCHSDRGSQYVSVRYGERLADLGALPSVGSKGDSYDNALAEATNALFKTELIKPRKPWRTVEQVELAALSWVWWFNHKRLHGTLGLIPPAEHETLWRQRHETASKPTPALAKQLGTKPSTDQLGGGVSVCVVEEARMEALVSALAGLYGRLVGRARTWGWELWSEPSHPRACLSTLSWSRVCF